MRFIYLVPALAGVAFALPECGGSCLGKAVLSTSCASTDAHCICSSDSFLPTLNECVASSCETIDQEASIDYGKAYCADVSAVKFDLKRREKPAHAHRKRQVVSEYTDGQPQDYTTTASVYTPTVTPTVYAPTTTGTATVYSPSTTATVYSPTKYAASTVQTATEASSTSATTAAPVSGAGVAVANKGALGMAVVLAIGILGL